MEFWDKNKKTVVTIAVVLIVLVLFMSYFGVLNPARMFSGVGGGYDSSSISIEVGNGDFWEAHSSIKNTITKFNGKIYRESTREYKGKWSASISVDIADAQVDNFLQQMRSVGSVKSFSSSSSTRSGYSTADLAAGHQRISVSLAEKASVFSPLKSLQGNALASTLFGSIVALVYFVIAILPWVIIIGLIVFVVKRFKKSE